MPLDKYYTRKHIVKKCMVHIDTNEYDCIVEPSAGAGAFLDHIHHGNTIAMDICPENNRVITQDWLKYNISEEYRRVLVIGNPPFGVNHSLSNAFILHSLSFQNVQTIGFVLPNTYKKHTRQRIIPDNWRIRSIEDLGNDAFMYDGEVHHMPCSFFVFDKSNGDDMRVQIHPDMYKESLDFYFTNSTQYDFFMFGAVPSKIIKRPTPNNRGYFIKSKGIGLDRLLNRIQSVNWAGNSCANGGVAWFTKPEIVMQYNKFIIDNEIASVPNPHYQNI